MGNLNNLSEANIIKLNFKLRKKKFLKTKISKIGMSIKIPEEDKRAFWTPVNLFSIHKFKYTNKLCCKNIINYRPTLFNLILTHPLTHLC